MAPLNTGPSRGVLADLVIETVNHVVDHPLVQLLGQHLAVDDDGWLFFCVFAHVCFPLSAKLMRPSAVQQ